MHINCKNCDKIFEVDENLIPEEGRLLQCGACNFQWVYKKEKLENLNLDQFKDKKNDDLEVEEENDLYIENSKSNKKIKNLNIFKLFLVIVISFIGIIIIIDTFKLQIQIFFPEIDIFLNNLYLSLHDVILFFKDLIK